MTSRGLEAVVIEARRTGRRPRYHRGSRLESGAITVPEQCNTDQATQLVVLEALPTSLRRPWAQLCKRCWAGTEVLKAAEALREATLGG